MALPTLRMTDSREALFNEMGWDPSNTEHTDIYQVMNNETLNVYEELISDPTNLNLEVRGEQPPYAYGQFRDEAIDEALGTILANATPPTRPYFVRGVNVRGDQYWVARWFLWHMFHNRGRRSQAKSSKARRPPKGSDGGAGGDGSSGPQKAGAQPASPHPPPSTAVGSGSGSFYDPVRG